MHKFSQSPSQAYQSWTDWGQCVRPDLLA